MIDDAAKAAPESVEPVVLRAELLRCKGNPAAARDELEKARSRFPKSGKLWAAQATFMGFQGRVDEALSLLDQAKEQLGERSNWATRSNCGSHVRSLWATKKGPQVVKALNDLAQNIEPFSKEDRRKLLGGLAIELIRQQDLQGASRLLSQLAEEDPNNLELRLTLLDLAFRIENKDEVAKKNEIEKNIKEIERIEESEGLQGRFAQVRYLIWQAGRGSDKEKQEELRTSARMLLNELRSHRADWSVIPLAQAQLEEQELAQGGLKGDEREAKEESIVRSYLQAIQLGQHNSAVVLRAVQLLFEKNRGSDALELLDSLPVKSQLIGDLGRQAAQFAINNGDFQRAVEIVPRPWPPTPVISRSGTRWSRSCGPAGVKPTPKTASTRPSTSTGAILIDGSPWSSS